MHESVIFKSKKEVKLRAKITFLVLFTFCASLSFSFETVKNLRLSAEGIEKLEIDCGAGFLHLSGNDSLNTIEVEAEIIVKGKSEKDMEEYVKKKVELDLKKQGNKAILISKFDDGFSFDNFRTRVINLTVKIPKNMDLYIDDGSGEIHIRDIQGDVSIEDGSGSIEVTDVFGNLFIDDGSGTIDVRNVEQNVKVDDGSGSITIDGVGGDVIIEDDGSGSLKVHNVKGKVIK